ISLLFWGRLAQAADRFLAPVIAVSLVILGTSLKIFFLSPDSSRSRALRWFAIGLALLALPSWGGQFSLLKSMPYWDCALGKITPREYLRATLGGTAELFEEANRLPTGSRILAIGEARRYYFTTLLSLSSVFDDHPIREFVSGAPDAEAIRARIAKAGYTHLLVNEYEIARLLDFHPPKALLDDKNFVALRSKGPEGYAPLIERYSGYIEFGPQPLTADEGRIYLDFLNLMRADAPFLRSGTNPHPAFWIAPISRAE
ncbi:hypothetical protein HYR69_10170, partial [Candidatus Sumerlaeota bacterium]|nr:hypothetical protein [Candidatus Sumerlaeota bacterium]